MSNNSYLPLTGRLSAAPTGTGNNFVTLYFSSSEVPSPIAYLDTERTIKLRDQDDPGSFVGGKVVELIDTDDGVIYYPISKVANELLGTFVQIAKTDDQTFNVSAESIILY